MSLFTVSPYRYGDYDIASYATEAAAIGYATTHSDQNANKNMAFVVTRNDLVLALFINGHRFDPHED